MATAPEQNGPDDELDPNAALPGSDEGQGDPHADYDPENDPYAPLATRMGWVPKDQFKGDVSKWKPAEDWIVSGHEIQTRTAKELREMKSTIDVMSRTTASIMEDKLAQQRAELITQHQTAVEDGDPEAAYQIARQIDNLGAARTPAANDPVTAWRAENSWYQSDPLATDLAYQTCDRLSKQGFSVDQQLAAARKAVEREFPELFEGQAQARPRPTPPSVRAPTTRTVAPSNRVKGFHDMPKAAQDVARDMANRKTITSVDDYAKRYWQMNGSKA